MFAGAACSQNTWRGKNARRLIPGGAGVRAGRPGAQIPLCGIAGARLGFDGRAGCWGRPWGSGARRVQTAGRRTGRSAWRWLTAPFSVRGLSGFALWGFFLLSVLATGLGFADLRAAGTETGELSAAELAITIATTLFVVSAMVVALHHLVSPDTSWRLKPAAFVFYLLFAVWSVGFGYGFFWKELAGQEFTRRQFVAVTGDMAAAVERAAGAAAAAELATQDAAETARARSEEEAARGGTCANRPGSVPGEGPLMRSRFAFADRAGALAGELRRDWIDPVAGDGARLRLQADALARGVVPAAAAETGAERERLEKLARAPELPSAERRALFTGVHEDARAFAAKANDLRALHAEAFAGRLRQLAAEVGADPARPGSPDPARAADPGYCWDVVLAEKLVAAAERVRSVQDVAVPPFEFLEGPKATRAAFFGLIGWMAGAVGIETPGDSKFVFDDKAFLALFASLAVDLGIVFLTLMGVAGRGGGGRARAAKGVGRPQPPRLSGILD